MYKIKSNQTIWSIDLTTTLFYNITQNAIYVKFYQFFSYLWESFRREEHIIDKFKNLERNFGKLKF